MVKVTLKGAVPGPNKFDVLMKSACTGMEPEVTNAMGIIKMSKDNLILDSFIGCMVILCLGRQ